MVVVVVSDVEGGDSDVTVFDGCGQVVGSHVGMVSTQTRSLHGVVVNASHASVVITRLGVQFLVFEILPDFKMEHGQSV